MTQNDETERSDTGGTGDLPDDRPLPGDKTYPADAGPDERPQPGEGTDDTGSDSTSDADDKSGSDDNSGDKSDDESGDLADSPEAEPVYNDRSKLDFDPDEGFYTGTAVTGDTDIPGEHERVDDVPMPEESDSDEDTTEDKNPTKDDDKA